MNKSILNITTDSKYIQSTDVLSWIDEAKSIIEIAQTEITDQASYNKVKDAKDKITKLVKTIDEKRKEVKEPYINIGKEIDKDYKQILTVMETIKENIVFNLQVYIERLEQEKLKRENDIQNIIRGIHECKSFIELSAYQVDNISKEYEEEASIILAVKVKREAIEERMRREELEAELKQKNAEEAERIRKEQEELQKERERQKEIENELLRAAAQSTKESEVKTSGASKQWKFHITNPNEVPREFCVPDEKLIRQAIKDGVRNIAGVNIYQDTVIR